MFTDKLKEAVKMASPFVKKAAESVKEGVDSLTQKTLFDAVMASCAYVISEGGDNATEDEMYKLLMFVRTHDNLKSFDDERVKERFESFIQRYKVDKEIGKAAVLESMGKIKNKEVDGRLVIRVAISIATASSKLNDKQKDAITLLCKEMGLENDFDMDIEVSVPERPPEPVEEEVPENEGSEAASESEDADDDATKDAESDDKS